MMKRYQGSAGNVMTVADKVLVVDDHPIVLDGIELTMRNFFASAEISTAINGADTLAYIEKNPDVDWIMLDINLPDINGIELLKAFRTRKLIANVIVLSSECDPEVIDSALKNKARGILSKSFDRNTIAECIKTVEQGGVFLIPEHAMQLKNYRESVLKEKILVEENISPRQQETLQLIAQGYSNQEIASVMKVAESTVKSHVSSLMSLFEADNRTHCVAEARRLKILL